jgi:hypothetical protein
MMKLKPINRGSLWLGETWENAIRKSLDHGDCGVEPIYRQKNPDLLLDDSSVLVGYRLYGYGNNRKYTTNIPKSLNNFVESLLVQSSVQTARDKK